MSFLLSRPAASPYLHGAIAAVILMALSLINGYAFFFIDSHSYIHGPIMAMKFATGADLGRDWPDPNASPGAAAAPPAASASDPLTSDVRKDHAYTINRSIYYGALAFAGYVLSDFWLTIYVQACLVAMPIALLWFVCLGLSRRSFYVTMLILAAATTLGVEVGLIMPDVLAGVAILSAAAVFVYWSRLRALDRIFLLAVMAFSALSHGTLIVILAAMIAAMAALSLAAPALRGRWAAIGVCVAAVAIGVTGVKLFDKALEVATGHKTIVMPHVMASLIWKGPGYDYLVARCPQVGLEICNGLSRLPQYPDDFLGADAKHGVFVSADLPTQVRLSSEQTRFALGVLAYDPVGVAAAMLKAGLQQAALFPVTSLKVTPEVREVDRAWFPPQVAARIENSTLARAPVLMDVVSAAAYVSAIASVIALAVLLPALARRSDREARLLFAFNGVVIFAYVVNAFVCGGINTPVDRYGARVIWLLPLLALVDFAWRRANAAGTSADR